MIRKRIRVTRGGQCAFMLNELMRCSAKTRTLVWIDERERYEHRCWQHEGRIKYFVRTCQECGHNQTDEEPGDVLTPAYRDRKCRKCKSTALDYGCHGWDEIDGKLVRRINPDEEED